MLDSYIKKNFPTLWDTFIVKIIIIKCQIVSHSREAFYLQNKIFIVLIREITFLNVNNCHHTQIAVHMVASMKID